MFLGGGSGLSGMGGASKKMLMELEFSTRGEGDVKKAEKGLDGLTKKMYEFTKKSKAGQAVLSTMGVKTLPQFRTALMGVGVAAGIAVGALAGLAIGTVKLTQSVIETGAYSEKVALQFETLMQSAEDAQGRIKYLYDFAATTPFQLPQIIDASVLLEAYGLNTEKYLRILGDTAAGMGRTLNESVMALAAAATGETERLKLFGITVAKIEAEMGHKINRQTTEGIQEMVDTVINIWEGRFSGGMEKLAKTWTGQVSMLQDKIFQFKNAIAAAGIFDTLKDDLVWLVEKLDELFESGKAEKWAEGISAALVDLHDTAVATGMALKPIMDLIKLIQDLRDNPIGKGFWDEFIWGVTPIGKAVNIMGELRTAHGFLTEGHKEELRAVRRANEARETYDTLLRDTERSTVSFGEALSDMSRQMDSVYSGMSMEATAFGFAAEGGFGKAGAAMYELAKMEGRLEGAAEDTNKNLEKQTKELKGKELAAWRAANAVAELARIEKEYLSEAMEEQPLKARGKLEPFEKEPETDWWEWNKAREEAELDLHERLMGHRWNAWQEEQHMLEMKMAFYTEMFAQTVHGGEYMAGAIVGLSRGMYEGMAKYGQKWFRGELSMKKTLLLATKHAAREGLASALDVLAEQAEAKAKFYAAEALGLAASYQFGAAAKAAAAAAAFGALAGIAAGGAAAARERTEEEFYREQEEAERETAGIAGGYEGVRAGGGALSITPAARPMNLTIVTNLNFIGGLNLFGEDADRELAERLIPHIQDAFENGGVILSGAS